MSRPVPATLISFCKHAAGAGREGVLVCSFLLVPEFCLHGYIAGKGAQAFASAFAHRRLG